MVAFALGVICGWFLLGWMVDREDRERERTERLQREQRARAEQGRVVPLPPRIVRPVADWEWSLHERSRLD